MPRTSSRAGRICRDHRLDLSLGSCGGLGVEGSSEDQQKAGEGEKASPRGTGGRAWPPHTPFSDWGPFLLSLLSGSKVSLDLEHRCESLGRAVLRKTKVAQGVNCEDGCLSDRKSVV